MSDNPEPTGPARASDMVFAEPDPADAPEQDIAEPAPDAPEPAAKATPANYDSEPEGDPEPPAEGKPNAGFAAMRAESRAAKARADAAEAKAANYERTFQEVMRRQAQPAAPVSRETAPDPDTDPVAHLKHLSAKVDAYEAARTAAEQQQAGWAQQNQALQALQSQVTAQEAIYRTEQPDYDAAIAFLKQSRMQELTDIGYEPREAQSLLGAEMLTMANIALAQGNVAPEKVYALAKRRGYGGQRAPATNGATPAAKSAAERVETMARAAQQGGTRAVSGGGAASPTVTLEYLASLPPGPAFDKAWEKAKRQGIL